MSLNYINLSRKADEEFGSSRVEEARRLLQKGLSQAKKKKEKPYIEFFLGELKNIMGDYKSGLIHQKKALKLDPKNPFLLRNLGVTYSLLGKEKKAIELFDRALEIKPNDYDSLRQKGVSLSELGKQNEAIELYDQALKIKPDDYNSLLGKGAALSELGKKNEAIELYDQALKIKPDNWYSLVWKAYTFESINRKKANEIYKFLQANLDKIKDKEIIDLVNFKIGLLETKTKAVGKKEIEKTSDVLNKVINAFQAKKDDFF